MEASYHNFADQRKILGIPNALNVISNVFLAMAGLLGLLLLLNKEAMKRGGTFMETWERLAFLVMFIGTGLTALGSAYYHLAPHLAGPKFHFPVYLNDRATNEEGT